MFHVSYDCKVGVFYGSFYFPEEPESIATEEEAWEQAKSFADKNKGRVVNVYVVDTNHNPVKDCETKKIHNI
jgi:hypothetical protein